MPKCRASSILQASSIKPARWPLISTDSLQDAAATDCDADACFVDPPVILGDAAALADAGSNSNDPVSVPPVSLCLSFTERTPPSRGAWRTGSRSTPQRKLQPPNA